MELKFWKHKTIRYFEVPAVGSIRQLELVNLSTQLFRFEISSTENWEQLSDDILCRHESMCWFLKFK